MAFWRPHSCCRKSTEETDDLNSPILADRIQKYRSCKLKHNIATEGLSLVYAHTSVLVPLSTPATRKRLWHFITQRQLLGCLSMINMVRNRPPVETIYPTSEQIPKIHTADEQRPHEHCGVICWDQKPYRIVGGADECLADTTPFQCVQLRLVQAHPHCGAFLGSQANFQTNFCVAPLTLPHCWLLVALLAEGSVQYCAHHRQCWQFWDLLGHSLFTHSFADSLAAILPSSL